MSYTISVIVYIHLNTPIIHAESPSSINHDPLLYPHQLLYP